MSDQSGNPYGSTPGEGNQPNPNPYGQPPTHSQPGQSPYGQAQQNPYGGGPGQPQPGFQQPNLVMQPKEQQSTTALVLGILGVVCCPLLGPFAWIMGQKSLRAIDASGGALGGRGEAKTGQVLGIVGTVFLAVLTILMIGFVTSFISMLAEMNSAFESV